tara:strand:- start:871 stop:1608 length:738 start_codon:yes stop_codon:yes gene_type:complete
MNFGKYSKLYDLLNDDKNYKSEAEYFLSFSDQKKFNKAIEIGSGTGGHAQYLKEKTNLTCIEKSNEMGKIAANKLDCEVIIGDILDLEFADNTFDMCFCLFHVINYLNTNKQMMIFFEKVSKFLKRGGKLIFDFWHTPSVYKMGAISRRKVRHCDNLVIERVSEPIILLKENIISVNFDFKIWNKENNEILDQYSENHLMRPFSIPEIQIFCDLFNLKSVGYYNNLTNNKPSLESWDICAVLTKI